MNVVFLTNFVVFHSFQRVGCDLRIGSSKKVDACGVCGGNGSTCSQPMYQWDMAPMSLCSVTCGGGKFQSLIYFSFRIYLNERKRKAEVWNELQNNKKVKNTPTKKSLSKRIVNNNQQFNFQ